MLEKGALIDGKYRILRPIGQGGMSVVYLAINQRANKAWAIKELRKNGSSSFEVVHQGLIAETNILKKLDHPHLPGIVDVIDSKDSFLIVMDYVEGVSLAKLIKKEGAQPWKDVAEWGMQLCDVLAYLHSKRPPIIYRDMKPDNVQLKPDGSVTLLDFGTAREYKYMGAEGGDTSCLGTRGYAAPEQYGGMGESDERTDIYCLGATMYHLLTGHNPSLPPYEMKPLRSIDPSLPKGLENIVLKCTQQDPELRYQNCSELMYDLENIEKADSEYRRKLKGKLAAFILCVFLSIVSAVSAAVSRSVSITRRERQYQIYMKNAEEFAGRVQSAGDSEYLAGEAAYKAAVKLRPDRKEAYMGLVDLYRDDRDNVMAISPAEEKSLRNLIKDNRFDSHMDQYAELAFTWGSYIYFYYRPEGMVGTGTGSISYARSYLEDASRASPSQLSEKDEARGAAYRELALAMTNIARGDAFLNGNAGSSRLNLGDDSDYTYITYWNDLCSLLSKELLDKTLGTKDSGFYLLSLYRSVAGALYENMTKFNREGRSKEEILNMARQIEDNCSLLKEREAPMFREGSEYSAILGHVGDSLEAIVRESDTLR